MSYLVYSIVEFSFIIAIAVWLSKKTKKIICKNCNQEFGAIPKKNVVFISFVVFCQMSFVNVFIYAKGLSFMCYLAGVTFLYYLFKREEYKCPNCKSPNQLP